MRRFVFCGPLLWQQSSVFLGPDSLRRDPLFRLIDEETEAAASLTGEQFFLQVYEQKLDGIIFHGGGERMMIRAFPAVLAVAVLNMRGK